MKELRTEIIIDAAPEKVWETLVDLASWPEWNPSFTPEGKAQVGEKVELSYPSGDKTMTLHCKVVKIEPCKELCWVYSVGAPFLFHGEHSFMLEPREGGAVHFVNRELFTGALVGTQWKNIDTSSRRAFEAMDQALKKRVESSL